MCGIVGAIHQEVKNDIIEDNVKKMNTYIVHRGPDSEGFFQNDHVTFGFRRLSIIDLKLGNQPLPYDDEKYWIVFNGEIYNYLELKEELLADNYVFKTASDTEVILAMYKKYGVETAAKLRGMFSFVIWDGVTEQVYGARDHFGIKPFHLAEQDGAIYFASEKKSLYAIMKNKELNQKALQDYLTFQYIPEPDTLTEGIERLKPGHYFVKKANQKLSFTSYWAPSFAPVITEEKTAAKNIRDVLFDSVEKHMRSDVTVGSFLSGGVDSSIIVAIAREFNPKLKTVSVGFEREGFSEIDVAKETAAKLNVENISKVITAQEFMAVFPRFVWHMDDPLADPAAVPQFFLATETRKHCKVALSGEGADELFGGYTIYNEPNSLKPFDSMPHVLTKALRQLGKVMPEGMKGKSFLERGTMSMEERYVGNAKIFVEPEKKELLTQYDPAFHYMAVTKPYYDQSRDYDPIDRMQYIDMNTWLVGDLLLNADRTTMAAGLELRTPFVDKKVFDVARTIPSHLRIANGTTKYILRKAAEDFVPEHVLYRKKLGFPVPIRHWLKDELYDWAKTIIADSQVDAYINKAYTRQLLEDHRDGKRDNSRKVWTILTFMVWHQVYVEQKYDFV